jgi:hypothetical protein
MSDQPSSDMPIYRAQVLADDGDRWVDGGLFTSARLAERDADRLAAQFGNPSRVVVRYG